MQAQQAISQAPPLAPTEAAVAPPHLPSEEVFRQAIALVQNELLPAVQASGERFFDILEDPAKSAGDGTSIPFDFEAAEAQARQMHTLISSLLNYLEQHALSGLPLHPSPTSADRLSSSAASVTLTDAAKQLEKDAKTQFEMKERLREAATIVRGVLKSRAPTTSRPAAATAVVQPNAEASTGTS